MIQRTLMRYIALMEAVEFKVSAIGIDVGGTTVDASLVGLGRNNRGLQMLGNVTRMDSPSEKPFEETIKQFEELIVRVKRKAEEFRYQAAVVGIGMPGPFDYREGVSQMKHKFQDSYGKNFRLPLEQAAGIPVFFVNDADAFGLGVFSKEYPDEKRLLAITLGTGLGAAFIVEGKLAAEVESEQVCIPNNGEVWSLPYGNSILEDYVSKRAIETKYAQYMGRSLQVHEIAKLARSQDPVAISIFSHFGENLGKGLEAVVEQFRPTRIVLGGQIAKSLDLFYEATRKALKEKNAELNIPISAAVEENYAIYGAAYYAAMKVVESTTTPSDPLSANSLK